MTWWPGWNSAESANTWAHLWFWLGMWCFLWLGISEVIAFMYGLRKDHLIEAAQSVATAQAKQDKDELSRQLAEADKKVGALAAFQAQRHLTPEQKTALVAMLSKLPGTKIAVGSLMGDDDGKAYRDDFVDVFNRAGWALDGHVGEAMFDKNPIGLVVRLNKADLEAQRVPAGAQALIEALAALNLIQRTPDGKLPISKANDGPVDRFSLIIGTKPRP